MKWIGTLWERLLGKMFRGKIILRTTLMIGALFIASMLVVQGVASWYFIDQNRRNILEYRDSRMAQINSMYNERIRIGRELLTRLSEISTIHEFQYRDHITSDNYRKTSFLMQYIKMIELSSPDMRVYVSFPRSGCCFGSDGLYALSPVTNGKYIRFSGETGGSSEEGIGLSPGVIRSTQEGDCQANLLVFPSDMLTMWAVYPMDKQNAALNSALADDGSVGAVIDGNCKVWACSEGLSLPDECKTPQDMIAALNAGGSGKQYEFVGRAGDDGLYTIVGFSRNAPLSKNIRNNWFSAMVNLVSLGCMLIWLMIFSNKVFAPVRNITSKINMLQQTGAKSEFSIINNLLDIMNSNIKNLSVELEDHNDLFMENMINRLATGSDIPDDAAERLNVQAYAVLTLVCMQEGVECREDIARFEELLGMKYAFRRFYRTSRQWSYYVTLDNAGTEHIVSIAADPAYAGFLILGISKPHKKLRELRDALEESWKVFDVPLEKTVVPGRMIYRCGNEPVMRGMPCISSQEESVLLGHIFNGDETGAKAVFDDIVRNNSGLSIRQQREICIYLVNLLYIYGREYSIFPIADTDILERIKTASEPLMMYRIAFDEYHKIADIFKTEESVLGKITAYVNVHYSEGINLKLITDQFGVSYTHVSRLFNQKLGISFPDYLNRLRVERAKVLVAKTDNSICAISELVGFDLVNTFNRIFKKHTGMTPGDWRKSHNNIT